VSSTSASSNRRRKAITALALFVPAAIAGIAIACGDPSHVYEGRLFVENRACVGTPSSIDVVEGEQASTKCGARCLAQPHSDGGRSLYVSAMCEPFPFMFDASGSDPKCPAAIAAYERTDTCYLDGGSANPLPPPPPPPVEDAAVEAAVDADVPDAADAATD